LQQENQALTRNRGAFFSSIESDGQFKNWPLPENCRNGKIQIKP